MKFRRSLVAFAALFLAQASAHAGASATRLDECFGGTSDTCTLLSTVTVDIQVAGGDVGKYGSFFIGARDTNDPNSYLLFTPDGWVAYNGGLYPAAATYQAMPSGRSFVVINRASICQMTMGRSMELFGGYGVIEPAQEAALGTYFAQHAPRLKPENIRGAYIDNDVKRNKKYWSVQSLPC